VTFRPRCFTSRVAGSVAGVLTQGGWVKPAAISRSSCDSLVLATGSHSNPAEQGGLGSSTATTRQVRRHHLVGLSRGAALAGYIAKNRVADRLLMFSGPSDISRMTAVSETRIQRRTATASRMAALHAYVASPHWIHDNDFYGNTGTHGRRRTSHADR